MCAKDSVKRCQIALGLSSTAMAEKLGVSRATFHSWYRTGETGRNCPFIYGEYCRLLIDHNHLISELNRATR